jgi:Uma2 family endonuclease
MATMILDRLLEQRLRAERAASGADRYDEVWEGVYMMAPMPSHEHQRIVGRWTRILDQIVTDAGRGEVVPGVNVSDRVDQWQQNYRVPDVAAFFTDTQAINHGSFWHGGPDFVIEVVSPDDRTRDKIDFYGKVATRELLLVDVSVARMELYRRNDHRLQLAEVAEIDAESVVASTMIGFQAMWTQEGGRPRMHARELNSEREWLV